MCMYNFVQKNYWQWVRMSNAVNTHYYDNVDINNNKLNMDYNFQVEIVSLKLLP